MNRPQAISSIVIVSALVLATACSAQASSFTLTPDEGTFAMAALPESTFGSAGGMNVSGATATNGNGQAQGITDSWLKFDSTAAVNNFDAEFGANNWFLVAATLSLNEVAAPTNPLFNRGVGEFNVNWVANDDWSEGTGTPGGPGTASGNQIGYTYSLTLLNPAVDEFLGTHQNAGANGRQYFTLLLPGGFTADIMSSADVTLYLTANEDQIGFTFNSDNHSNSPYLVLEAQMIPEPGTLVLLGLAAGTLLRRRRAA
jgi:hypothetical protein